MNPSSTTALAVDDFALAAMLGLSVHFLRKDRQRRRLVPYYRIGGAIRYDPVRVRAALLGLEEGGQAVRTTRVAGVSVKRHD